MVMEAECRCKQAQVSRPAIREGMFKSTLKGDGCFLYRIQLPSNNQLLALKYRSFGIIQGERIVTGISLI
jgi:hypothetical protein